MAHCWEIRGCDEEMQSRCPHAVANDNCPPDCHYASCDRPTHVVTSNFEFFLSHAPAEAESVSEK